MKKSLLLTVSLLATFGAGCMSGPAPTPVEPTSTGSPSVPARVPAPTPTPTPGRPSLQPNGTTTKGPESVTVTITADAFSPKELVIYAGDTVVWVNKDKIAHNIAGVEGVLLWDSGSILPGKSYSRVFPNQGGYKYHTGIKPVIEGIVTVR